MVADRYILAAYYNKHCWRACRRYQHRWPWTTLNPKIGFLVNFSLFFWLRRTLSEWIFAEIAGDWQDHLHAYEIILMLWRVSWALAQISCTYIVNLKSHLFHNFNSFSKKYPRSTAFNQAQVIAEWCMLLFFISKPPEAVAILKAQWSNYI